MAFIKAVSYYLPDTVVSNEDLIRVFPEWSVEKVAQKVGVISRHVAGVNETACDLAEHAAMRLFSEYKISPSEIDFIILCTQSPDYRLPSTACILQHRLGIPTSAGAFDYNLGCSGCIYGLALSEGLISSGIAKNVLLITSETYNKYIHPDDKGNRSIFGDGAAACLVSTTGFGKIGKFILGTDGSCADSLIVKTGGARHIDQSGLSEVMEDGRIRRDDYLYMDGSGIFNFTLQVVPDLTNQILKANDCGLIDVDYFVFHQANRFMLNTIRKVCSIPKEKFYNNIEETGNTVSSTILIALKDCLETGMIKPGMKVLLSGFGVGLSWGGTMLFF